MSRTFTGMLTALLVSLGTITTAAAEAPSMPAAQERPAVGLQLAACYRTTRVCYSSTSGRRVCRPYRTQVSCGRSRNSYINRARQRVRKEFGSGRKIYRTNSRYTGRRG